MYGHVHRQAHVRMHIDGHAATCREGAAHRRKALVEVKRSTGTSLHVALDVLVGDADAAFSEHRQVDRDASHR